MTPFLANLESSGLYWLIVWGLAATAVSGGAAVAAFSLRRHSAQARHRIWALSMLAALAAPCLAPVIPVPRWWRWSDQAAVARDSLVESPARGGEQWAMQPSNDRETAHSAGPTSMRRAGAEANLPSVPARWPSLQSAAGPSAVSRSDGPGLSWRLAVVGVWLGGIGVSLLLFAAGSWKVHRLRKRSLRVSDGVETKLLEELCRRMNIRRPPQLLVSPQALVPFLAGVRRAAIVLPAGYGHWPSNRLEIVLTHELIHLVRRDVIWEIVAQLALVPAWFHPFGWFAIRRLRIERELACDDAVLLQGAPPADYAEQLVEVAAELHSRPWNPTPVVAIAGASPIERRIRSILDPRTWRTPLGRWRRIGLSVCMAGLVVVVAVLSPASGDEKEASPKSPAKTPEQATSAASDADRQIAAGLNHPTTIQLQNVSPENAFLALSKTSGCPIAFDAESFAVYGAEISPTVTVRANGEPLRDILRSLGQSAIGGAKIGISVTAIDGALTNFR